MIINWVCIFFGIFVSLLVVSIKEVCCWEIRKWLNVFIVLVFKFLKGLLSKIIEVLFNYVNMIIILWVLFVESERNLLFSKCLILSVEVSLL